MRSDQNFVWIDLEMTGLDPERDTILEVASVVTDGDLRILEEGPGLAIHQPEEVLALMDPWCLEHHGASGLLHRVRESRISLQEAQERTLAFIQRYCPEKASPLCGNSVYQDRRFLSRYMPRLDSYLHYRLVDVSTVKELVKRWYPEAATPFPKAKHHLAMDDVKESIAELRFYRERYFR